MDVTIYNCFQFTFFSIATKRDRKIGERLDTLGLFYFFLSELFLPLLAYIIIHVTDADSHDFCYLSEHKH